MVNLVNSFLCLGMDFTFLENCGLNAVSVRKISIRNLQTDRQIQ